MTITINVSTLIAQQLANNGIATSQAIIDSIIKETVADMIVKNPSALTEIIGMSQKKQALEQVKLQQKTQTLSNTVSQLTQQLETTNRKVSGMNDKLDQAVKPKTTQDKKAFKQSTDGLAAILGQIAEQKMTPRNKTLIRELQSMLDSVTPPKTESGDAMCKTLSEEALLSLLNPNANRLKEELAKIGLEVVDIPVSKPSQAELELIRLGFPECMFLASIDLQ